MRMKIRYLLVLLLAFIFLTSCEFREEESNLETLVSYLEKIDREDLSKIIQGANFRAEIIYQDEKGDFYPLTLKSCYDGFVSEGYSRKFSYQFCQYLLYTALNKVLEKRINQLEPEVRAFIEDYKNYIKKQEETINKIKEIAIWSIPIFFAFAGLIVGIGIYKLISVKKKKEKVEKEISHRREEIELYIQQKKGEAKEIVANAIEEASQIKKKAKEEANLIKEEASILGYKEGQMRHKKELKSLRTRLSAIKSIFKTYPELDECFKKVTGWNFEKWLKGR